LCGTVAAIDGYRLAAGIQPAPSGVVNDNVEAVSRLFRARGFDSVTVAEIMGAAGLTHGGFYGHFKSKDHPIAETLARTGRKAKGTARTMPSTGRPARGWRRR